MSQRCCRPLVFTLGLLVWLSAALLSAPSSAADGKKKIVFMAGGRSHSYGTHEHYAGSLLLAKSLQTAVDNVEVVVHRNGWPQAPDAFDGADCVVMYCDGGGGHPVNRHLQQVEKLAARGCGIVCIHYGVEVPKGAAGDRFLDWIGGYFETHWSVNPHWTAEFKTLPQHPIMRGVKPFVVHDEWYYHMRFREDMQGVTPILSAVPPASTLSRRDGAHSNNPHVRKTAGQPQHVAWAAERPDGGRGFGFTGGHFHWNWGDDNFRRVMLNAILWCAKMEVPAGGVGDQGPTLEDLEANQDEPPRGNREEIREKFKLKSSKASKAAANARGGRPASSAKPLAQTKVLTARSQGKGLPLEANIRGAKQLFLVVNDGGNGYGCDWADWAEPRLIGPKGELKLTELKWRSAVSGFGQVRIGKNAGGGELRIANKPVAFGIGTHANSVIEYQLPPGYEKFVARVGLDNGGTDQGACGGQASVQFAVYTEKPPTPSGGSGGASRASRDPADATAALDVYPGLEVTRFASEPDLLSLTNLDIDYRGRIWVCEVVNYRRHKGKRAEGDRILILEDTDGDGQADSKKVFYQGNDVDSAMGICVLGNRVIVSCSPNVLVFTDSDGDDKPDSKEVLFTKTGQPQHDHSMHSFLFGPDGKLYWNFGNTGKAVHDKNGSIVVDRAGNQVIDNGRPYFGGMPFRCDLDGSNFEVLAHNFRNNYEVTVDSFGTLWQSDNDDDGNRGVRINFVMEFGNYGYREEGTGRGWKEPRTGMHQEVPQRHWHLNDPGVVPNLLQTGAGSPTGITVYEGRLLPRVFWDQLIHCDAGPNIVRAYPVKPDGAGFRAESVDLLHGARDNWFRPADVCVAPDGSLFVTDWYDPGVGGHNMQDLDRGRLFRIAPPGHAYRVPKFDFSTVEGAIEALKNPALSVRYMAWQALHRQGEAAETALRAMFEEAENPRHKARALWLLGSIHNKAEQYVELGSRSDNPQLRIVALRLARQRLTEAERTPLITRLVRDPSPAVRRQCAIALRELTGDEAPQLWAALAAQHDGQDRWYLEALGIAANDRWNACLDEYQKLAGGFDTKAGRDLVWRSRGSRTPQLLAAALAATKTVDEAARLMRAFDFQSSPAKNEVLLTLAFGNAAPEPVRDFVTSEAIKRLEGVKLDSQNMAAVEQVLQRVEGQQQFVDLITKFNLQSYYPALVTVAAKNPENSLGVAAAVALLDKRQQTLLNEALRHKDVTVAASVAAALGNSADGRVPPLLLPLVNNEALDIELRRQATRGLARSKRGAEQLLAMAQAGKLPESLVSAASVLSSSPLPEIRQQAVKLFPPPPAKNNEVVPPVRELVKRTGSLQRGAQLFATSAQCATCHVVNKQGKEVGPDLSEIGRKLSRQAMIESILYPSAGISHNYENHLVQLENGTTLNGILLSRTAEELVLRTDKAIVRKLPAGQIVRVKKLDLSLMPADLQKQMTVQDLLDVVEYLTTLKQAK